MRRWIIVLAVLIMSWLSRPSWGQLQEFHPGQTGAAGDNVVYQQANRFFRFSVIPSQKVTPPGSSAMIAIEAEIDEGHWLYGPVPKGKTPVLPLRVRVQAGNWQVGDPLFPRPQAHSSGEGEFYDENYVYTAGHFRIYVPVKVPSDAQGPQDVQVTMQGGLCDPNQCLQLKQTQAAAVKAGNPPVSEETFPPLPPGQYKTAGQWEKELPDLPLARNAAAPAAGATPSPEAAPGSGLTLWGAFALAVLAGLILNVMPCVLPVVPLKILSILQQSQGSRRRSVTLGLSFAGGIMLFFVGLAILSVVLRLTVGRSLGWGELLGHWPVTVGLALLMVVLALNLFNVFTVSVGSSLAGRRPGQGHAGSAFMGFVAAVLSTPCSFAILTAVLGWAQFQKAWIGASTFLLIGAGMAFPHVLLTSLPRLLERLPRPGRWMELLKQGMAFLLLLVAAWLLSLLGNAKWMAWAAAYAVMLAFLVWLAGAWVSLNTPRAKRWIVRGSLLLVAVVLGALMLPPPAQGGVQWQSFDLSAIEQARQAGQPVLVKFSAEWCVECHILQYRVFDRASTAAALRQRHVAAFEGDVTRDDLPAQKLFHQVGGLGVPMTLLYLPGQEKPILLYGVYSQEKLLAALDAGPKL